MEAARLLLGAFDLEAAHDPHRGLLVLRVADVEAAGGALQLPSPPRSPSASPVRSQSSTSRSRSRSWRRSPARRPPTPPPPPVRRESEPEAAPEPRAPAAPGRRRRRRGNRAGQKERDRRVARAANRAPGSPAPALERARPPNPFGAPPGPSPFRGHPPCPADVAAPASAAGAAASAHRVPPPQVSSSPFFLQPVPQSLPPWLHTQRRTHPRRARPSAQPVTRTCAGTALLGAAQASSQRSTEQPHSP